MLGVSASIAQSVMGLFGGNYGSSEANSTESLVKLNVSRAGKRRIASSLTYLAKNAKKQKIFFAKKSMNNPDGFSRALYEVIVERSPLCRAPHDVRGVSRVELSFGTLKSRSNVYSCSVGACSFAFLIPASAGLYHTVNA